VRWLFRHIAPALFALLLLSTGAALTVHAQQSEEFSAIRFDGGNLFMDARLGSNLFGSGMGAGSFGGIQSALGPVDGASVFGNPAHLSFIRKPQLGMEVRLPLSNGTFGLGPDNLLSNKGIRRRTDNFLSDLQFPDGESPTYTSLSGIRVGQPRQLAAFWMNWPVNDHVTLGFGYRQPLLATTRLEADGFSALLRGKQASETGSVEVDFLAELAMNAEADISLEEINIGTGGLLESYYFGSVWWGITFYRYFATARLDLDVLPQGALTVSGSGQYYFNDPSDPGIDPQDDDSNQFFWQMRAGYRGAGFGTRIGFVHRTYGERVGTSFSLNLPPKLRLVDPSAFAESYLPVFINLSGTINPASNENTELLDIDRLDTSQPNITRKSRDFLGTEVLVRLPASLTAGLDLPLGRHLLVLNGIRYLGEMSAEGQYSRENGVIQSYRIGIQPSWGARVGLDLVGRPSGGLGILGIPVRLLTLDLDGLLFQLMGEKVDYAEPRYRFAASFTWGEALTDNIGSSVANSMSSALSGPTPVSLSMGRTYTLMDRMHVGVHVAGVPGLLMRFSVAYDVD
jgi:hypothetical protein